MKSQKEKTRWFSTRWPRPWPKQGVFQKRLKPRKKPRIWLVRLPDLRCFAAEAMTKSEARAQAKKHFQLQRLPVGTMVGEEL